MNQLQPSHHGTDYHSNWKFKHLCYKFHHHGNQQLESEDSLTAEYSTNTLV